MPLVDGVWERGKCSYKMLSYMASGVPVVVSPVGMNADLLAEAQIGFSSQTDEEWVESLTALIDDDALARRMGTNGRVLAESTYSVDHIADRLGTLLRSVIV